MYLHTLHFKNENELWWAFQHLTGSEFVEDCLVEQDIFRIRFVTDPERAAKLIEKIYLRGGLTWCVRHHFKSAVPVQSQQARSYSA